MSALDLNLDLSVSCGGGGGAALLQAGDTFGVIGCSISNEKGTGGLVPWMLARIQYRLRMATYGYQTHGGDESVDYVDRAEAITAQRIKCVMVDGYENDANAGRDPDTWTKPAVIDILDALTAPGVATRLIVLSTTIIPTGLNQTKTDNALAVNTWIRTFDGTYYNGVKVIVHDRADIRSGGDALSDSQGNGIHNSALGAAVLGFDLGDLLLPYIGGSSPISFGLTAAAGNLNPAFDFAGTGGTVPGTMTGQIGTGWVGVNGSGAPVAASKTTMADGVTPGQAFAIGGGSATTTAITATCSIAGLQQVGTYHSYRCLIEISAADGTTPINLGAIGINGAGTPAGCTFWDTGAAQTGKPPVPGPVKNGSQVRNTVSSTDFGPTDVVWAMWGVPALAATTVATATFVINIRCVAGTPDIVVKIGKAEIFLEDTVAEAAPYHQSVTRTLVSTGATYNLFQKPSLTGSGNSRTARLAACSGKGMTVTHQWRNAGGDIVGATNALFDSLGVSGTYFDRQIHTNAFGSITVDSDSFTIP